MVNWPPAWTRGNMTYSNRRFMIREFEEINGGDQAKWDIFTGGCDGYTVVLTLVNLARSARDERKGRDRS
jgi:hypothetical protein